MAAFVICYVARAGRAESTKALVAIRGILSERWEATIPMDGTWIVEADAPADAIRDLLTPHLARGDALMVIGAGADAAWSGFEPVESDWLVDHI